MKTSLAFPYSAVVVAVLLAGCAGPGYYGPGVAQPYPVGSGSPQPYPATASATSSAYGTVDSLQVTQAAASASGTGAVLGGVVGGLLGNQVGGGRGKKAATIAGVVGGAMVGHQIEQRNAQARDVYQVGVRMDNGGYRTLTQDSVAGLQVGGRVRIENDRAYQY